MNEALRAWREDFDRRPKDALDRLVRGVVPLGAASQLSLGELLGLAFEAGDAAFDAAARAWLAGRILQPVPEGMTPSRWAVALDEFFRGIATLCLGETGALLRERHRPIRLWLRGLYEGSDRDPEGSYLLALAHHQSNQAFSTLWRRLVLGDEMPERGYRDIGLLGFRKMPDAEGRPAADVPPGLLRVVVELADRHGIRRADWVRILRALFAAYRRSQKYWSQALTATLESVPGPAEKAREWIAAILPLSAATREAAVPCGVRSSAPVPVHESLAWVDRVRQDPSLCDGEELAAFLNRHRAYARGTGDSEFLVKTFNNLATRVIQADPRRAAWAIDRMEEALDWQPYNPHNWTVYAQALWAAARHSDAIDVLWQARQRFPWNAFMRTELGRLLREAGDLSTSEGVCREAAGHFPANIVCRTSLGETLIDLGNLDGAERVYDEARGLDAHNAYARTGLAQVWFIRSARVRDTTLRDRAKALLEETVQQGNRVAQQLLLTFEERWQRAVDRGGIRPRPAVTRRRIEEMSAAERLGRAMIALWQAERAPSDQERDRLCEEAQRYLDVPESAAGDLLMGFVETRGLVILARGDAQAALDYFRDQIERRGRGGWIGIRLGEQRARGKLGETVELSLDETPFDSRSVRFSVQVANVLSRLAATGAEREVGEMLKMLYPSAARLARQWAEDQEGVDLAARSSAMLASFLDAKWYRPAGIAAEEDLNDPQRVIRAIENVRQTEADTFDVLANTALAAA